jgi:hypothetical protein
VSRKGFAGDEVAVGVQSCDVTVIGVVGVEPLGSQEEPGRCPRHWDNVAADFPYVLAPVAQVLDQGLDLTPATIFVGENGSGKSSLVEAIALAYGLSPEGGSTGARHSTRSRYPGI